MVGSGLAAAEGIPPAHPPYELLQVRSPQPQPVHHRPTGYAFQRPIRAQGLQWQQPVVETLERAGDMYELEVQHSAGDLEGVEAA